MRSKTKIIVLHLKELIYTGILLVLGVGLLFLLLQTFLPKKAVPKPDYDAETSLYLPGKYTSTVQLGNDHADVEVVVDSSDILSIRLVNLSQTVTAMYPLVEPCMDTLAKQICEKQSLEGGDRRCAAKGDISPNLTSPAHSQRKAYHADDHHSSFAKEGLSRQLIQFLLPCHATRIRRHPKVSPRRYRDTSDFRSVRQARTLKLLCKEAAAKGL